MVSRNIVRQLEHIINGRRMGYTRGNEYYLVKMARY